MFPALEIRRSLYAPSSPVFCNLYLSKLFVSSVLKFSDPFTCILYIILSMDYFDVFFKLHSWIFNYFYSCFLSKKYEWATKFLSTYRAVYILNSPTHSPSSDSLGSKLSLTISLWYNFYLLNWKQFGATHLATSVKDGTVYFHKTFSLP